jgi:poly-beta-1,6-N-acetyl-D-glucosamine synthase
LKPPCAARGGIPETKQGTLMGAETVYVDYAVAFLALYITVIYILLYFKNRRELENPPKDVGWRPHVSVIIPAYNEERRVGKCLDSVLALNYPRELLEVIVVDDGSKDGTSKVAEGFASSGVRVFRKENSGKADSMNYGIERATGEIIATLDADSYPEKDALLKMLPLFESEDVGAVTAAVKVNAPNGIIEKLQSIEYLFTIFSRRVLVFMESVHVTPGPFSLFRKSVFAKIGGFDKDNILEDQEIAMRMQKHHYKIRSSIDAEVHTDVPHGFWALLRQRTRWHRGGLRNSIKYSNLVGAEYGDFGVFVMPFGSIAMVAMFLVFTVIIYRYLSAPDYLSQIGLGSYYLCIGPVHILGFVTLVLTLAWVAIGLRTLGEKSEPLWILFYVFIYGYLICLFWVSAIYNELKNEKLIW